MSTVDLVYNLISERVSSGTFCDPFGGLGIVGSQFKAKGYSVWTGDILTFAHYFQIAKVKRNRSPIFKRLREMLCIKSNEEIIALLNKQVLKGGWFSKQYSERRSFFTKENAERIDGCRLKINYWNNKNWLTEDEYAILISSLTNSMDKVANTAGTYYAYLKSWHRKALSPFRFELIQHTSGITECHCFLGEAKDLVSRRQFDVLYLDPPYNRRCYSQYYHLPETIAKGEAPMSDKKSGIPKRAKVDSGFNKPEAKKALEEILENSRFGLLAFHYSDYGIIKPIEVRELLTRYGRVEEFVLDSKGYTTVSSSRTVEHRLYLVSYGQATTSVGQ